MCLSCGADFAVPMGGGESVCPSCAHPLAVGPRVLAPLAAEGIPDPAQEQQRMANLRKQADKYNPNHKYAFSEAPDGYEGLLRRDKAEEEVLQDYLAELRRAVAKAEARDGDVQADRAVYWLVSHIKDGCGRRGEAARAVGPLHTALDVLDDLGYQHALRTKLADIAMRQGDAVAADAWMALCDPRPRILDLDSDYRWSQGLAAGARGRWEQALDLVGETEGRVPYDPASVLLFGTLRLCALEELGRPREAEVELARLLAHPLVSAPLLRNALRGRPTLAVGLKTWKRMDPDGALGVRKPSMLTIVILVASLLLPGLGLLGYGVYSIRAASRLSGWSRVEGTVVHSSAHSMGGKTGARIRVTVRYRYAVAGRSYESTQISDGKRYFEFSDDRKAAARLREYPVGKTLRVWHDPNYPARARMVPASGTASWLLASGGALLILLCFPLLWFYLRQRKRYNRIINS